MTESSVQRPAGFPLCRERRLCAFACHPRWMGMLLGLGVFAVYLRTLAPGILGGDAGEMQFVPYILSLPHPTGTPLYCLLGKLWSSLPLGPTVAWRMSLLAAVSAALAIVLVYWITAEAEPARKPETDGGWAWRVIPVPALAAALSLAFAPTFWEQAILADKYAFNALLVALVIWLALRWGRTRSPATLNGLAFAYGLSLAHHRTMILFAPTLLAYVCWLERGALWRDRRRLARLMILFLAPLLLYLYLPWAESRGLPPGTWHPRTLGEWRGYLFDTGRTGLVYIDRADLGERLAFYGRTLWADLGWGGLLLGVAGLARQWRRSRAAAAFLSASFLLQAFLAANHHVPRHWVYFIPSFLIFALWVGEGAAGLLSAVSRLARRRGPIHLGALLLASLVLLAWPLLPFRERYRPRREAHLGAGVLDVWRQTLKEGYMGDRVARGLAMVEPDAIIVCDWEQATPLWYLQQVEGVQPGVKIIYPIERLDEAAAEGRPLYIARAQGGLAERWHPSAQGALVALRNEPLLALPEGAVPLGLRLGEEFELAGYVHGEAGGWDGRDAPPSGYYAGTVVPVTIYWRAVRAPAHDYSVSLRLFDPSGNEVYKTDSQHPVLGTYPTSRWRAGEIVGDYHEIQLRRELAPGTYRWGVVLYRSLPEGGWVNLRVAGSEAEIALGGAFEVVAR